jgi:hypothetical protein
MDIEFELESLLLSRDFRIRLNQSLASRGYHLHVALVTQEGTLISGSTPGVNPLPTESNEMREEDIGFLAGLPGSAEDSL